MSTLWFSFECIMTNSLLSNNVRYTLVQTSKMPTLASDSWSPRSAAKLIMSCGLLSSNAFLARLLMTIFLPLSALHTTADDTHTFKQSSTHLQTNNLILRPVFSQTFMISAFVAICGYVGEGLTLGSSEEDCPALSTGTQGWIVVNLKMYASLNCFSQVCDNKLARQRLGQVKVNEIHIQVQTSLHEYESRCGHLKILHLKIMMRHWQYTPGYASISSKKLSPPLQGSGC